MESGLLHTPGLNPVRFPPTRRNIAKPQEQGANRALAPLMSSFHLLPRFRSLGSQLAMPHHVPFAPANQCLIPVPPYHGSRILPVTKSPPAEPTHPLSEVKNTKVVFASPFSSSACSSCPTEASNSKSASPNGPRRDCPANSWLANWG